VSRKRSYFLFLILISGKMRCLRCNSPRILRFIDGFGVKRAFCKDCWFSAPENSLKLEFQKNLNQFGLKVGINGENWGNKYRFV